MTLTYESNLKYFYPLFIPKNDIGMIFLSLTNIECIVKCNIYWGLYTIHFPLPTLHLLEINIYTVWKFTLSQIASTFSRRFHNLSHTIYCDPNLSPIERALTSPLTSHLLSILPLFSHL